MNTFRKDKLQIESYLSFRLSFTKLFRRIGFRLTGGLIYNRIKANFGQEKTDMKQLFL